MTFLVVQGISKRYRAVAALDGIEFAVPAGSRTAIVGPSGSGKTTLLRLIAGFETPDVGRIVLDGRVLADGPSAVPAHRRDIGIVSQDGALFPHLNVADNIGFGLQRREEGREAHILELMDTVDLDRPLYSRRPHELSGGQQQRVAVARALARKPKLMLLDEPFSALDAGLRESMRKAVAEVLRRAEITSLLVTHDQTEALSFADQVAVLHEGRLAQIGTPRELYLRPRDTKTARFLGDAIVLPAELGDGWVECQLGRLPADTVGRRGWGEIMLRPDQVQLLPVSSASPTGNAGECYGKVTVVEFGGTVCTVVVALLNSRSLLSDGSIESATSNQLLMVKSLSVDLPPIGTIVHVTVRGKAHVF
jgi:iron(III) transport system ATP-binding protein